MATEDVARALMSMDDPEIRRRVGEGDFAALGEVDLTPQEQALLSGATPVLPDGHPSKVLVEAEVAAHNAGVGQGYWPEGTARAIEYVQGGLDDPKAQAKFRGWMQTRGDQFP